MKYIARDNDVKIPHEITFSKQMIYGYENDKDENANSKRINQINCEETKEMNRSIVIIFLVNSVHLRTTTISRGTT